MKQQSETFFQQLAKTYFRREEDEDGDSQIVCPSCEALNTVELTQTGHECSQCLWRDY